jgi:hypothetical protein
VNNTADVLKITERAFKDRKTCVTTANSKSSRSQLIFVLKAGGKTYLVIDLAGLEDAEETADQRGIGIREAYGHFEYINQMYW